MNEKKHDPSKSDRTRLLVIDDEENMRHMLTRLLTREGYRVETASDGREALDLIENTVYDFILCDLKMPNMDGMEFFKTARDRLKASTVVMMSAYGTIDTAIDAIKMGAYDYIAKPFKSDEVVLTLKKAQERESLKRENRRLKDRIRDIQGEHRFEGLIAKSKSMQDVFKMAEKVAFYNTTVLISGESGTGKELIAKAVHYQSNRSDMAVVPVNCGGIPENLLESELFGYKKGAFTGADQDKKGLFEAADGGTIFLDEIQEMPLSLQVKLLRVLQENEIRRVGDAVTKTVDVRVIAATAQDPAELVEQGRFREDLFYRLNVIRINMPPLRERREDIPLLCHHFIHIFTQKFHKKIMQIAPDAMSILLSHQWPGNVRELENVIERAVVLAETDEITADNLPPELGSSPVDDEKSIYRGYSLKQAQQSLEKEMIRKALVKTNGNKSQAARLLEISHPSLLSKIKTYGLSI